MKEREEGGEQAQQMEGRSQLKKGLRMELEMDALTHARGTRTGVKDMGGSWKLSGRLPMGHVPNGVGWWTGVCDILIFPRTLSGFWHQDGAHGVSVINFHHLVETMNSSSERPAPPSHLWGGQSTPKERAHGLLSAP